MSVKWNAEFLSTPGTVEVPVSELEALQSYVERLRKFCDDEFLRVVDPIISHLPAKPDHVESLREMLCRGVILRNSASVLISNDGQRAALEAAIDALEAQSKTNH